MLAIAALLAAGCQDFRYPPGVLVPEEPAQVALAPGTPWELHGATVTPLASYNIRARVLRTTRYWGGREATFSPVDLAVGWGPMSDQRILDHFSFSQGGRVLSYHADAWPIPLEEINSHSANMHIVPSSDEVAASVRAVRAGDIVSLSGYLVAIDAPDGWHWRSSLSRTDRGWGACELMWVDGVRVQPRPAASAALTL